MAVRRQAARPPVLRGTSSRSSTRPERQMAKRSPLDSMTVGGVPERSKGPDCKSGGSAFAGSNPAPATDRLRRSRPECAVGNNYPRAGMAPEGHEPPRTDPESADHDAFRNDGARLAQGRYASLRDGAQPALLDALRRLRRRLAGDHGFGDALTTTGTRRVEVLAQGVSTLPPERDSVAQEIGLAGLQVWQSLSEATGRGRGEQPL